MLSPPFTATLWRAKPNNSHKTVPAPYGVMPHRNVLPRVILTLGSCPEAGFCLQFAIWILGTTVENSQLILPVNVLVHQDDPQRPPGSPPRARTRCGPSFWRPRPSSQTGHSIFFIPKKICNSRILQPGLTHVDFTESVLEPRFQFMTSAWLGMVRAVDSHTSGHTRTVWFKWQKHGSNTTCAPTQSCRILQSFWYILLSVWP